MKRLIFKKEDLTQLPTPELGYITLGVSSDGGLSTITDSGTISSIATTHTKTILIEQPTSSENISIFKTDVAITVKEVTTVSTGTTPSTTYQIKHSSDRSASGNNLTTSTSTTSKTTGDFATLSNVNISANSWVWLVTTAASGTDVSLTVDIKYTIG
jgi:hypothetical protein